MRKSSLSIFLVLSLFLIFPACAIKKTLNIDEGSKQGFSSPLAVLEKIDSSSRFHDGVKAIARIEVNTPEGRYPLKVLYAEKTVLIEIGIDTPHRACRFFLDRP